MSSSSKKARIDPDDLSPEGGFKIKTYYPTLTEMKDFSAYVKKIHDDNGHRAGLAKIVPPSDYVPRKAGYADDALYDMSITNPIKQEISGESGLYQQFNIVDRKRISVREFKKLAEDKYPTPVHRNNEDLERIFWKNIFTQASIYGADVSGSLYDDDVEEFHLERLNTILDNIGEDYGVTIQGVNTAYLYFGMWKSSFSWHTEDMDLYSINYLHDGQPKSWYCIAPEHGKRFERLAASFFPHSFRTCKAFLRHKTTMISPQVLKKYSIPYSKCTQFKGEFMITFPFSYHSGYNHGFNIAEATNFALEYWIDFGKWASRCECSSESVKISMQTFVKRYQSDRYENWLKGKDICKDPRDPKHVAAAPKPTEYDLYLMGIHNRNEEEEKEKEKEEENIKKNTLQQNNNNNGKEANGNDYSSLAETLRRYSEFLMENEEQYDPSMQLTHYSPIPTKMQEIDHLARVENDTEEVGFNFVPRNTTPYIGHNIPGEQNKNLPKKPDYQKELAKIESRRRQKEERARKRKEKKAREQPLAPKELLQYLPMTFTQEKRFNRCVAAIAPHCSICQILVPFPKDDEAIWGNNTNTSCAAGTNNNGTSNCDSSSHLSTENKSPDTIQNISTNSNNPNEISDRPSSMSPTLSLANSTVTPSQSVSVAGPKVEEFKLPESSSVLLPRGVFNRYFRTTDKEESSSTSARKSTKVNSSPRRKISGDQSIKEDKEADTTIQQESLTSFEPLDDDKLEFLDINLDSSELLQCSVCMLCVHKLCYGLENMPENKADWICDRCVLRNRSIINCELCPCRGGAIKEYKGTWLHLTCALSLPDVDYIDVIKPQPESKRLKSCDVYERVDCFFCTKNTSLPRYVQGRCMKCSGFVANGQSQEECSTMFHATCAHRNGAEFDYQDKTPGSKLFSLCQPCRINYRDYFTTEQTKEKPEAESIVKGTRVVALASDNYYYEGVIEDYQVTTYYSVYIPKLSTVENCIPAKKIVDLDPNKTFRIGDKIVIKTRHGNEDAKYKGQVERGVYKVRFDDGDVEDVTRENIYFNVDQLPDELLSRFKCSVEAGR